MAEYYPKNIKRPIIVALIVGILGIFVIVLDFIIPRFIAIPLAVIAGVLILTKMNPK